MKAWQHEYTMTVSDRRDHWNSVPTKANKKKMQQSRKLIWQKEGENFRMVDLIIPSTLIMPGT
jgi:hypothetical protein